MPTNLYGPGDNFDIESGHVIPGLMRKAHEARHAGQRELVIWGSGTPRREFLHVDDSADALVRLMTHYSDEPHVNVGSGSDISIFELAKLIADVVGFTGAVVPDPRSPTERRAVARFEQAPEPRLAAAHRARRWAFPHLCLVCRGLG